MGALADAVLEAGGEVIGVIPRPLATRELAHPGLSEMRLVDSMHERKATMASLADGFVALPGRARHPRGDAGDPHLGPARHSCEAGGRPRRPRLLRGAAPPACSRPGGRLRPLRARRPAALRHLGGRAARPPVRMAGPRRPPSVAPADPELTNEQARKRRCAAGERPDEARVGERKQESRSATPSPGCSERRGVWRPCPGPLHRSSHALATTAGSTRITT